MLMVVCHCCQCKLSVFPQIGELDRCSGRGARLSEQSVDSAVLRKLHNSLYYIRNPFLALVVCQSMYWKLQLAIWGRKDVFNLISTFENGNQCSADGLSIGGVTLHSKVGPLISIMSVLRSMWLTSPVAGMMDWPSMPSSTATGTVKCLVCVCVCVCVCVSSAT